MVKQNDQLALALSSMDNKQREANATVISILNYQNNLNALIASENKQDIRKNAILAIKSGAELDEQIQKLHQALPDSGDVKTLQEKLNALRPKQMRIIGFAKKNRDEQAMETLNGIQDESDAILAAAKAILMQEFNRLKSLSEHNRQNTSSTIWLMLAWTIITVILVLAVVLYLNAGIISAIAVMKETISEFARGMLNPSSNEARKDEVGETIEALNHAIVSTGEIVGEIRSQSEVLRENSRFIADGAKQSSDGTIQLDQHISHIKQSAQQLLTIADDVHEELEMSKTYANNTSSRCDNASHIIEKSQDIQNAFKVEVNELADQINQLSASAESISEIAATISSVSDQTNLLALNAAIEAARAGEHGRGFAVVAEEVRSLATRSSEAVENISQLAQTMTSSVTSVTEKLTQVQQEFDQNLTMFANCNTEIITANTQSNDLHHAIHKVMQGISEQQNAINEIYSRMDKLTSLSYSATANSKGLQHLSGNLQNTSEALQNMVAHFKLEGH